MSDSSFATACFLDSVVVSIKEVLLGMGSGGQAGVERGGWFRTSRRTAVVPFTVRTLTAKGKTVVDASESRAKVILVAFAVRAPASARTWRTLAGVGKA